VCVCVCVCVCARASVCVCNFKLTKLKLLRVLITQCYLIYLKYCLLKNVQLRINIQIEVPSMCSVHTHAQSEYFDSCEYG